MSAEAALSPQTASAAGSPQAPTRPRPGAHPAAGPSSGPVAPAWTRPRRALRGLNPAGPSRAEPDQTDPGQTQPGQAELRQGDEHEAGHTRAGLRLVPLLPPGAASPSLGATPARGAEHGTEDEIKDVGLPTALATAVARSVAEALRGCRTVHQLGTHLDLESYRKVERRVRWEREARARARLPLDPGPLKVLSCHVQRVSAEACECTCTLLAANRARALSFRLEIRRGRWKCVEVEIG